MLFPKKVVTLPQIVKTNKFQIMMFTERIKQLREEQQIPQRKLAAALEIDTATYCKYEKGERRPKREQVVIIANLLQTEEKELLTLWLADQVTAVVSEEKELSDKVLNIAKQFIKK
jgi:transcriptional regulator with XRE-family HTH domain